jgi:predicted secreted protein
VLPLLLASFSLALAPPATKTLTISDSGKTITIAAHQRVQIRLVECRTCGFSWSTTVKPDPKVLKRRVQGHKDPPCSTDPCPVGGSGTTTFRYEGNKAGRTTLQLAYIGPGQSKPSKTFRLTVRVR